MTLVLCSGSAFSPLSQEQDQLSLFSDAVASIYPEVDGTIKLK